MADDVSFNRIPDKVLERWAVVRDVLAGDQAVRDGGYLPFLNKFDKSEENVARNAAYVQRAVWYPATHYTLEGLMGMAFRVDPNIDLPSELEYLLQNADGAGTSLYQQAQETVANILGPGRHGLYVDWSEGINNPVFLAYHAETVINWKYRVVNGQQVLTMVVLEEEVELDSGRYAMERTKQWRELSLEDGKFIVRLYREAADPKNPPIPVQQKNAEGELVDQLEVRSQTEVLDFIPFIFVGAEKNNGNVIGSSPLYGLAQLNLSHFRNSADHEDSVFYTGQAQPWIAGLDVEWRNWMMAPTVFDANGQAVQTGQRMYVGSRAPLLLPQGGAFGYAQPQPNSLVKDAMIHKEAQMIAVGARLIEPTKAGSRTATEDDNDKETSTSVLSMCVANVNEAYQQCISWAMRWKGHKDFDAKDTFKITQEFVGKKVDAAILTQMVASWQTGLTAKADVRNYMRAVGLLPADRTDDDIDSDLQSEGPRPGTLGDGGTDGSPTPPPGGGTKPPAKNSGSEP